MKMTHYSLNRESNKELPLNKDVVTMIHLSSKAKDKLMNDLEEGKSVEFIDSVNGSVIRIQIKADEYFLLYPSS